MFANQMRQWCTEHTDTWVTIVLPKDCMDQGWILDGEGVPRQNVVWADELGLYYDKLVDIPTGFMQMWNLRNGKFQADGIITSRRSAVIGIARELWDHRLRTSLPIFDEVGVAEQVEPLLPVFIDESMVVNRGTTSATVSDIEMLAQSLGYAYGWPIFDTEVQKQNAMNAARHFLSGHQALKALEKSTVIACGFEPGRIDRSLEGIDTTKNERFTCFFGGRLNRGAKRADVMFRTYDEFFRFGRDVDITVCSPKDEGWILDLVKKEHPEIQVLVQTPSDEFKQRAAKAHVFLNTSAHEGFSVGFSEMMYMTKYRTVLIAPRVPWVKGMFKEEFDRYPFLYEDFDQARAMLRWVHQNYEEAADQAQYLGDWVREQYDGHKMNEAHWQHFRTITDQQLGGEMVRGLMSKSSRELCLESLDRMDPDRFSIEQLYQDMIDNSRAMKAEPRRGQTTKFAVRRWLINEGFVEDLYDDPVAHFRKLKS